MICEKDHYLQEQEAGSTARACSDGAHDSWSSESPTVSACCARGRLTGGSMSVPSLTTCSRSMVRPGAARSTCCQRGFPASLTPCLESDLAQRTSVMAGATPRGSFARWSPLLSGWRTAQTSLLPATSASSSVTFPRQGMMRSGRVVRLPMSVRHMGALECGFSAGVKIWPTPTVCGNYNTSAASAKSGDGLATAVRGRTTLLPAPLNPEWIEWLMGWPIGATASEPWAMGKYRNTWWSRFAPCPPSPRSTCRGES